ncbi:MAG: acylphosphatase [Pirellulaceae bacterium]|nr:acylphosphatase [Planctomycetales bacterium]
MKADRQRRESLYRGHVQGVGFRFTTREIAARFDVTGFVENLPDGRVRLVAEGASGELDRFLEAVSQRMGDHIHESVTDTRPATGEFSGFGIRA